MTQHTTERYALAAAGAVIAALTAGGFWLSYAHLAEVAGAHGLGRSPVRQWAWPATLDSFIVAGELLMLRAGLRNTPDRWAVALTATGSVGSIALNVAGSVGSIALNVAGVAGSGSVPLLNYIVAAVPPTAALLAFGALMRQIRQLVSEPGSVPEPRSEQPAAANARTSERPAGQPTVDRRPRRHGGRPADATIGELLDIGRVATAEQGDLSRAVVLQAIRAKGLKVGGQRLTEVMRVLRTESGAERADD
jgi:hypothetical protein